MERADQELLGMVAVAVSAEIQAHDPEALGERRGDFVPPMQIGAASVQQHHAGRTRVAAQLRVQVHPVELGPGEAQRLHLSTTMLAMIATAQKRLGKAEIRRFSIVTAPGRPYDPAALKAA